MRFNVSVLPLLFLVTFFQFDVATFAAAAGPIAVAIIAFAASFSLDVNGSRVRSAIGLLAAIYGAAASFGALIPPKVGVPLAIAGILVTSLNERLQGGASMKAVIAFFLTASILLSTVACGPPSRKTLLRLQGAGFAILNTIDVNATLPDQLLAEKLITPEKYAIVKNILSQIRTGVVSFNNGMVTALAAEKADVSVLAPVVADIIVNVRQLSTFVTMEKVQKLLAAAEISLRVIGSYFALQIADAHKWGLTDKQICARFKVPYQRERFNLLANTYDGARFEEYALAAGV